MLGNLHESRLDPIERYKRLSILSFKLGGNVCNSTVARTVSCACTTKVR